MFETLVVIAVCRFFFKIIGLAFSVTWSAARIVACILSVLALPVLVLTFLFAGGAVLLFPVALVAAAFGLLKACV